MSFNVGFTQIFFRYPPVEWQRLAGVFNRNVYSNFYLFIVTTINLIISIITTTNVG